MVKRNHGGAREGAGRPKDSRDTAARMTAKQERFVAEYLVDLNGTQAAIRSGYSGRNADRIASELLRKAQVRAAVDEAKIARGNAVGADAEWVLRRLVAEADADLADIYDEANNLRPVREWPAVWRKGLVQGVEVEEIFEGRGDDREQVGVVRKIKLDSRVRRLELIGKHVEVNAFQERIAVSAFDGLAERLARADARALVSEAEAHDSTPVSLSPPARPEPARRDMVREPHFYSPPVNGADDWLPPQSRPVAGSVGHQRPGGRSPAEPPPARAERPEPSPPAGSLYRPILPIKAKT